MIEKSNQSQFQWRVIKESVLGASHARSNLPNQDWAQGFPETGASPRALLAIADGHGGAKYFRSDQGAKFAVSAAEKVLKPLLEGHLEPSEIKNWAIDKLPQQLVKVWQDSVEHDYQEKRFSLTQVFSTQEHTKLRENENEAAVKVVENNPLIAYGSTILAALVTDLFILYVQLGDGDILTVSESGEVTRPIPADQRLIANETTSLCSPKAWGDFRVNFQRLSGPEAAPALILISTDGYANSFRNESDFTKVGSDLLHMIGSDGLDTIKDRLAGWLDDASKHGSGDDISLGIIARMLAIQQVVKQAEVRENGDPELETEVGEGLKRQCSKLFMQLLELLRKSHRCKFVVNYFTTSRQKE